MAENRIFFSNRNYIFSDFGGRSALKQHWSIGVALAAVAVQVKVFDSSCLKIKEELYFRKLISSSFKSDYRDIKSASASDIIGKTIIIRS